jgi:hypothetical protein
MLREGKERNKFEGLPVSGIQWRQYFHRLMSATNSKPLRSLLNWGWRSDWFVPNSAAWKG